LIESTDPFSGLNAVQAEAVRHRDGALLLLAGAGSGKTRVVTCRIAQLLRDGAHPSSILAVTFTNRAAREMRERVRDLLGLAEDPPIQISTFHSLGARMLRQHAADFGRTRGFVVYDEADQVVVLRGALEAHGQQFKVPEIKRILRHFSRAKNDGETADQATLPNEFIRLDVEKIGAEYEARLARSDAFDFGDLILRPAQLLEGNPGLCAMYQRRWQWVMVDEFQDTNVAQYRWLKALSPPGTNLFVVGDDDQSIYGWRGADVGNIINFPQDYHGAKVVRLEQNYRSHRHILDAANEVIQHNNKRLGKTLWTARDDGPLLQVVVLDDARREANWVANRIAHCVQQDGVQLSDIAVLMRANHMSLDVETCLRAHGIRYSVIRGRAFFDRAEVRDALAYVRLAVNQDDEAAFRRAVAAPSRGVGKGSMGHLADFANVAGKSLWAVTEDAITSGVVKGRARNGLRDFLALYSELDLVEANAATAADALEELFEASGLLVIPEIRLQLDETDRQKQDNIRRLLEDLRTWAAGRPEGDLGAYLEEIKLVSDADALSSAEGSVSLMTVHAAKGLEFPVVFVIGMEEGVFPHANSLASGDVEEERRLCYVAITRAKERLMLSRARARRGFGETRRNAASRFLGELPATAVHADSVKRPRPRAAPSWSRRGSSRETPQTEDWSTESAGDYQAGMRVWHAQFGAGTILKVSRGVRTILQVQFKGMDVCKVVADFVSPYEG
jgi:DNA helicase II / ATP-dependent DNA helicase PcrA